METNRQHFCISVGILCHDDEHKCSLTEMLKNSPSEQRVRETVLLAEIRGKNAAFREKRAEHPFTPLLAPLCPNCVYNLTRPPSLNRLCTSPLSLTN